MRVRFTELKILEGRPVKKSYLGRTIAMCWGGALLGSGLLLAQQAPKGDWSIAGADAGQSGWQKAEAKLSKDSVPRDFKFLWKIQLGPTSRSGESYSEPLLALRLINAQGFKDIAFWGSGDTLYAVDSELGNLLWKKKYALKPFPAACAASSMSIVMEPPAVINFNARRAPGAPPPVQAPPLAPTARRFGVAPGGGGFGLKGIYVLTPDGMLHEQVLTTGVDFAPAVQFLPGGNASPFGLNIMGKTVYATTGRGCGSVANGVWALDMTSATYPVTSYSTGKVRPLSLTGAVIAPDGTAFIVTGAGTSDPATGVYANSVVAVGKDMKPKDWYTPPGGSVTIQKVSPITFAYKERQLVVAPGKDGSFVLLDAAALGGADHHTALSETASFSRAGEKHTWDGFASWQDKDGSAWVFASVSASIASKTNSAKTNGPTTHGGVVAFKVDDADGKFVLTPAWISRDMVNPAPPVIANGVLVALSTGNPSTHATLYVLDALSGKELYSSKDSISTYAGFSGVSVGDSHAFFTDHNNVLYSYGIGLEH